MFDFLTIGSATVDIIVRAPSLTTVKGRGPNRAVGIAAASKTDIKHISLLPGGSAANSAVTLAHLGEKTAVLTAVGPGPFGKIVLDDLRTHKVNTRYVKVLPEATASAVDIITRGGEKAELVYRGAVSLLSPKDFSESMVKNARHVFITSMVSDKNYGLFKKAVAAAKKQGKPLVLAPSITMLRKHAAALKKLKCDVFIVNLEEARLLTGKKNVLDALKKIPGKVRVITSGAQGAHATDGTRTLSIRPLPVKVIDTTGAGDCFSGAFAHAYYRHGKLGLALQEATAAAGLKLQTEGARYCHARTKLERCMRTFLKELQLRDVS
jgi:ribokinase